ncbi:MAG TPA: L-threonine 3-dehydrogenase [Mycobacteriales bacterium]|jgi:threonine 3-dehydrogenase|nr:L-threonine 3-dehydrogenase [Mycobacteriales bacterium]
MKALVKAGPEAGLVWSDVPVPEIGRDDILIRVLKTGVCGTDLHIYAWDHWAQTHVSHPLVVGHEFVGEVAATGEDVHDLTVGDLVSGEGHLTCGRCRNCMAGRRVECARTKGVGVNHPGCFAEYIALPATNVWRHHADIDLDVAAIFDPFGNAVHTALTFPVLGEDVLITGAGPIGVMAALVARHAGARHVVVTDVSDYRLDLARSMGVVSLAVNVGSETLDDAMRTLHMTEGFDVGLEMSGNPQALRSMLATMRHGGSIAMLGLPTEDFGIDWNHLVLNMITIRGIYGRRMFETWYEMSVLIESGLDIKPVITHRFTADAFEEAFAVVRDGRCGKVILDWADR